MHVNKEQSWPLSSFLSTEDGGYYYIDFPLQKILDVYSSLEGGLDALNANSNVPNTLVSLITNSKKKGN